MHEFGVIIGQFQPFSNAHYELVRTALTKAKKVIIIVGSDFRAKTIEVPWSTSDRMEMIMSCFSPDDQLRLILSKAKDYLYNENLWIAQVQARVDDIVGEQDDVVLFGYKNEPKHYSELFPQWRFVDLEEVVSDKIGQPPSPEKIRDMYFTLDLLDIKRHVPEPVFDRLKSDMMVEATQRRPEFSLLKEEFEFIRNYREQYKDAPFPPTFVTVDAVIIKSGHVLVVRRRSTPGKGLIALPGGFLEQRERILDGCLREVKEETRIKLAKTDILSALKEDKVFDHPRRSLRGRTITHAFCFNLGQGDLPKVQGDDDADKSWWMSLRDVLASEDRFFEDHFHIINHFVNRF